MKLKLVIALVAGAVLIAPSAFAQIITYKTQADNLICTTSNPCDGVDDAFAAAGTWEGADNTITIDWNGGPPANSPVIVQGVGHTDYTRVFDSSATSGCDGEPGDPAPQSFTTVRVNTYANYGAGNIGSVTANGSNWDVSFGPVSIGATYGHGQYCKDITPGCPGGCAAALIVPVETWLNAVPPVTPQDMGTSTFSADLLSFTAANPAYSWRYFDLNPGINIYGVYSNQSGAGPYYKAQAVPFMAPVVAFAMAGGLAYMGVQTLRRKDDQ